MIRVEIPDLESVLRQLPDETKARKALSESLNRGAIAGRKIAVEKVKEEYTARHGAFSKYTKIDKSYPSKLGATILFYGPMTNLNKFDIDPKRRKKKRPKKQLTAIVKRGHVVTYKGAFIGPNNLVFRRLEGTQMKSNPKKEAIANVYGPSIAHLLNNDKIKYVTELRAIEMVETRLTHHIKRFK